jgi:hypothetical protein
VREVKKMLENEKYLNNPSTYEYNALLKIGGAR